MNMSMKAGFTHSPPVEKEGKDLHEDAPGFFRVGLLVEVGVKVAKLYRRRETRKSSIYTYAETIQA